MSLGLKLRTPTVNIEYVTHKLTYPYLWPTSLFCLFFDYVTGSYLNNELVDHDQADQHGDVGQQGEDGQHAKVPDENQQHQEGQEGEHVESRVHGGCQDHGLVVVAVIGGRIGRLYHLGGREGKKQTKPLK